MTLRKLAYEFWTRPIFPFALLAALAYYGWGALFGPEPITINTNLSNGGSQSVRTGDVIAGPAYVMDGDTLVIDQVHIRLHGIDAFELNQSCKDEGNRTTFCGQNAATTLAGFINEADVTCIVNGIDRYNRAVAVCASPSHPDLNAAMVHAGMALAYRQFSTDYVEVEDGARIAKIGAWSGFFMQPWIVRNEPQSPQG